MKRVMAIAAGAVVAGAMAAGPSTAMGAPGPEGEEASAGAPVPIRTLVITGANNHNWRYTSRLHAETLAATGLFDVEVTDEPAKLLADRERAEGYGLFVLDYNGPRWGEEAEQNFVESVRAGAGVVCIHASAGSFQDWSEYGKVIGMRWITGTTGHGKFHDVPLKFARSDHPITRGMTLGTQPDELYHRMVPTEGVEFEVVLSAFDSPEIGGHGGDEPMAITLRYGEGRVFHTTLGHVWEGVESTKPSVSTPTFRALLSRGAEWAATGEVSLPAVWTDLRGHNRLSSAQVAAGWELLFDGRSARHLRAFRGQEFPTQGWVIEDGAIRHVAGAGGGDIVTREQYDHFELELEWKAAPGANSGIMFHVGEDRGSTWETGPEMQILDNAGHADGRQSTTSAGALYGLLPCAHDVIRPAGEWNAVRIRVHDGEVVFWANGIEVVRTRMGTPEWDAMVAKTKFASMPHFGKRGTGHIALQDHGDDVWFRNIRVRPVR